MSRRFCDQPDRDVPGIKCGYPLPCPYHTAIMEVGAEAFTITIPSHGTAVAKNIKKLKRIARALQGKGQKYTKPEAKLVGGGPIAKDEEVP